MTDRPILFSGPMVRAILEGRKTQTRRALKPVRGLTIADLEERGERYEGGLRATLDQVQPPIWKRGDRLWVRETCATWEGEYRDVVYRADITDGDWDDLKHDARSGCWKTRPSIHMPRWASRLTLVVSDVRVQRLQDIGEDDAMSEGIARVDPTLDDIANGCTEDDFVFTAPGVRQGWGATKDERNRDQWWPNAIGAFQLLWDSLNAESEPWDRNPWVAALTFEVHRCNIDQMETRHD